MSDLVRQSEENGHRLQTLEGDLAKTRSDQEQRLTAIEQKMSEAAAAPQATAIVEPPAAGPSTKPAKTTKPEKPKPEAAAPTAPAAADSAAAATAASDPAEDAYSQGFHLWEDGRNDDAIAALRAFASTYPKHRRTSYANNLIGRALLAKGDIRPAAKVLLDNYRDNPKGERAPDSLFYLGQALMQLGQAGQACKAYAELDAVYGAKIRPDLKKLETDAKAQAQCS